MSTIVVKLLDSGKAVFNNGLLGQNIISPHSFKVGTIANSSPNPALTDPVGAVVFSGLKRLISARRQSSDTVRYALTIPETEGPFTIGNAVFYVDDGNGNPVAFLHAILPFPITKLKYEGTPTPGQPNVPGNRFVFNLTIKHTGEATGTITVATPNYSSLASFDNDLILPPPNAQLWQQFSLQIHEKTKSPVLGMRRVDDTYWGVPFWQRLNDPDFGIIDGGVVGDGYTPWGGSVVFGAYYLTPEERFTSTLSGGTYLNPPDTNLVINGGTYV